MRPLTVMEQRQRYVHKYVHLSWHLQAAIGAPLGEGAPQYCASGRAYDLLKGWGTTLWQAAARLHTHPQVYRHALGRANALHAITRLAEFGVSLLAQEQTALGWSRPDWWVQVVGLGRALLFAQLVSLARKGTMPVLVVRDAFWVISNAFSCKKASRLCCENGKDAVNSMVC